MSADNNKPSTQRLQWLGALALLAVIITIWLAGWHRREWDIAQGGGRRAKKAMVTQHTNELGSVGVVLLGRTNDANGVPLTTLMLTNHSLMLAYRYYFQAEVKSNGTWNSIRSFDADELSLNGLRPRQARIFNFSDPQGAEVWRVRFWGPRVQGTAAGQKVATALGQAGIPSRTRDIFTEYSPEIRVEAAQPKPVKAAFENR